jgi:glutamine synthetase
MPDPNTWCLLPWSPPEHRSVARMFCDILRPGGQPFEGDPRYVLRRNLKKAADLGYTFYVGPELEFFYFKLKTGADGQPDPIQPTTEVLDRGGYFDLTTRDAAIEWRRDTVIQLEKMGIGVEYSHHEVADSQHEIDMRYTDALTMADNVMTYRLVVKEVAMRNGIYASFMPKPIFGANGSGMHVHQSLFKGDKNAFFDANDDYNLSKEAKNYIAGLLKHAPEITAVCNQWVNSYKRLVPGYEAPGLSLLGAAQPVGPHPRTGIPSRPRESHPNRIPLPGPPPATRTWHSA